MQPLLECQVRARISISFHLINLLGKVAKLFFTGEEHITNPTTYLKSSVDSYNNALGNMTLRIVMKVYELVKGKRLSLQHGIDIDRNYGIERGEQHGATIIDG
jgi:hypothetical protein